VLTVEEIVEATAAKLTAAPENGRSQAFQRVVVDSRQANPGSLFVALKGERVDGHDFISDAIARGATGLLVHLPPVEVPAGVAVLQVADPLAALWALARQRRERSRVRVIGITGSVGKTTCKELTASVLSLRYVTLKNEGNLNTEIGLPLTLLELTSQHQAAVLEMGMFAAGDIALLCELARPDVGVITNIGPTHMERLGSLEAIAAAKAELIESLPAEGVAILSRDDPLVSALAGRTKARVLWYGTTAESDIRGDSIESRGLDGFSFDLTYAGETVRVSTPLPGRHNLHNLLAAAAVGLTEGLSLAEVAEALGKARPTFRLRVVAGANGSTIIDDSYNASPISVLAALDLLAETPGRHLALLGDMRELGAAEAEGHAAIGRRGASTTDVLYATGEKASLIADAARAAGHPDVRIVHDRAEAIEALKQDLRAGDHLLVKASRALELERVVQALAR